MFAFRKRTLILALALSGSALLSHLPASATSFCYVKPTKDGFVALRAGPSAEAKLIGKMHEGDEVLLGQRRKGSWQEVTWWRSDERHTKGFEHKSGSGWVHRKLIEEEC